MLLTETGTRVEGTVSDVLTITYWTLLDAAMSRGMTEVEADALAVFVLPRLHAELAQRGHIVRDLATL